MPPLKISAVWVTEGDAARLRRALGRRRLVLASASPRRARVLQQCGVDFVVSPVEVGEQLKPDRPPSGHVVKWSRIKARAAAEKRKQGLILAADTVVACGGRILGKPSDRAHARRLLETLSGKTHTVYSGMTLLAMPQGALVYGWCTTKVRFHRLSAAEIEDYVDTGEPLDKAGAYGIQGAGCDLVSGIDGPLDNVVGLPVGRLVQLIERLKARSTR